MGNFSGLLAACVSVGLAIAPLAGARLPIFSSEIDRIDHVGPGSDGSMSFQRRLSKRDLLDVSATQVTIVRTAEELQEAVARGDVHVEIREHLYLGHLDLTVGGLLDYQTTRSTLNSIRGNCSDATTSEGEIAANLDVTSAPLRGRLDPSQCLLVADSMFLWTEARTWLHNVYIRLKAPTRAHGLVEDSSRSTATSLETQIKTFNFIRVASEGASLYMTQVTMQGDGGGAFDCTNCGVEIRGKAALYAEDCMFADFDGQSVITGDGSPKLNLVRCAFAGNNLLPKVSSALITAFPSKLNGSTIEVRLEDCSFTNTTPEDSAMLLADVRGLEGDVSETTLFYSDPTFQACVLTGTVNSSAECSDEDFRATGSLEDAPDVFLTARDTGYRAWIQEVRTLPKTQQEPTTTSSATSETSSTLVAREGAPEDPDKSGDRDKPRPMSVGAISGLVVAGVTLVITALAAAFFIGTRYYRKTNAGGKSGDDSFGTGENNAQTRRTASTGPSEYTSSRVGLARSHREPSDCLDDGKKGQPHLVHSALPRQQSMEPSGMIPISQQDPGTNTTLGTYSSRSDRGSYDNRPSMELVDSNTFSVHNNLAAADVLGAPTTDSQRARRQRSHTTNNSESSRTGSTRGHPILEHQQPPHTPPPVDAQLPRPPPLGKGSSNEALHDGAANRGNNIFTKGKGGVPEYSSPKVELAGEVPSDPFGTTTARHARPATASDNVEVRKRSDANDTTDSTAIKRAHSQGQGEEDSGTVVSTTLPVRRNAQNAEVMSTFDPEGREGCSLHISCSTQQHQSCLHSMPDEEFVARAAAPILPPAGCDTAQVLEYIKQQLDCFGKEPLLLGKYQLLGPRHRATGGQGVVQFARRVDGSGTILYAVKFFAHRADYAEEADIYRGSPLRHFMPSVIRMDSNEGGTLRDPFGGVLAPFIVMEKGESLQERARNGRVDLFTAAQILGHISQRISELHQAGYAHRDLKPGNIMWQPRTYTWVLIDFGLAARIGESAPFGCTPTFAAPETAQAWQKYARKVVADAKVDAWALGVIAFELLLERPAFGPFASIKEVYKQLADPEMLLPWEEGRLTVEDKSKLGRFRKPIIELLQRDPERRDTAGEFCKKMVEIFSTNPDAASVKDSMPVRRYAEQAAGAGKDDLFHNAAS